MSAGRHRRAGLGRAIQLASAAAAVAVMVAAVILAGRIARPQAQPHCRRTDNCQCRQFGEFHPGHDRCPELPAHPPIYMPWPGQLPSLIATGTEQAASR